LNIIIIFISAVLIYHIIKEVNTKYIVIEPFEVPESLTKDGLTGRVIANKLLDQIDSIRTTAKDTKSLPFITNCTQSEIDIEVPGAGISISTISKIIGKTLNMEPIKIVGEVYIISNKTFITTRVSGKPYFTTSAELQALDSAMNNIFTNNN
jgi:hypothetical protein